MQAIQESPGVEKVYIESYNETPPRHVHFRLIPRFFNDTQHLDPALPATADIPEGFRSSDVLAALANSAGKGSKPWHDSPLTDAVRDVLNFWNKWLSPYPLVGKFARWRLSADGRCVAGELYVLGWFLLLFTIIGFLWQRGAGSGPGAALNQTLGVGPEAADSSLFMDICPKTIETSLVLVVGLAIAMVIGKIGNTFHEAPRVGR